MNKEDYVSLEVAKMLKEKGFNEPCRVTYFEDDNNVNISIVFTRYNENLDDNSYSCPTLYEAQKWLREKHQIHIDVGMCGDYSTDADGNKCDEWNFWTFSSYYTTSLHHIHDCEGTFNSYEEALNDGILEALKLI